MRIARTALPVAAFLFTLLLGCGSDETAPGDPSTTAPLPDVIFFNDTSATVTTPEIVVFEGVARDNVQVSEVAVSFTGGTAPWYAATLSGFGTSVGWRVTIGATALAAGSYSMVIQVSDGEQNVTQTPSRPVEVIWGSTFPALQAALAGATAGDAIYLSSGRGYAYGNSIQAGSLSVTLPLALVGTGYAGPATVGGYVASGNTPGTILEVDYDADRLLYVSSDLSIYGLRLKGGGVAVDLPDAASDVSLEVKRCLFEGQENWALRAVDSADADTLEVSVSDSVFDVSAGGETERGGISLTGARYLLEGIDVLGLAPVSAEVGVSLAGGTGQVTDCLFERNSLAMYVSNTYPLIASCAFTGGRNPSSGIEFASGTGSPVIRRCSLTNFAGFAGFAVRVGGSVKPVFFRNTITGSYNENGAVGILVDGPDAVPDLGTYPFRESGYNRLTSPRFSVNDYVIYVTDDTTWGDNIMAGHNFWGAAPFAPTYANIHAYKVWDHTDSGGAAGVFLGGQLPYTAFNIWNGISP